MIHSFAKKRRLFFWWALAALALLALALRLGAGWELSGTAAVANPLEVTDMATYRRLALQIRQGIWPSVFDYQPFYYTILLPLAYCFSPSGGVWPVIIIQSLLGASCVALSGICAARLFGRLAGIIAAAILALSRYHIFYTPYLLLETCFSFWVALTLYFALSAMARPLRIRAVIGLSSCLGLAVLTRGSAVLWLPGMVALLAWQHRASPRRLVMALAIGALCYAMPILPYAVHNSRSTGHLCGASVAGGKVLALGNSPEAPAGGLEYPRTYHQWCAQEADRSCSVPQNILRWLRREPALFADLVFRKLLCFWDRTEIPNNISFEPHASQSRILHLPVLLPWAVIGTLGLAFLLRHGGVIRRRKWLMLSWMLVAYWLATSAFYILARFRIGALPLLAVAGAGFLTLSIRQIRFRASLERNALPCTALALAVAAYAVCGAYGIYRRSVLPALHRRFRPDGYAMSYQGRRIRYDHGPLLDGGMIPVETPSGGLTLTKRLITGESGSGGTRAIRVLLQVIVPRGASAPPRVRLRMNGRPVPALPRLVHERQAQWLAWEFTAAAAPEAVLQFGFPPAAHGIAFVADTLRDYGRTRIAARSFQLEYGLEANVELETKAD